MNIRKILNTTALSALVIGTVGAAEIKVVPGEMIVKLKKGISKSFLSNKSLGIELKREISLSYETLFVVKNNSSKSITSLQNSLNKNPNIEYAEPNFIYSIVKPIEHAATEVVSNSAAAPTDPKFGELWGLHNTGSNEPGGTAGIAGADINAYKAWGITKGDRSIKIAVIDTGIDYNHPDLKDQMWTNTAEKNGQPGVDDDGNGYVDDIYGYDFANSDGDPLDGNNHGTHCAGTIGATHDNGEGVAGVMANVSFVAVKFLTDAGSGTTEGAIKAIDYATKLNVDIMSNSWGGGGFSQALEDSIKRASDAGIIFTAAAGNSTSDNDSSPHYPSNYQLPNVISVAAHTAQDTIASFSSYGKTTVHIAAPGHKIMSTTKNGGYQAFSGTSMATPHVSGALGLLLAKEGRMDHLVLRNRLIATSVPTSTLRGKTVNGGRLDAFNLLTNTRPERNEPKADKWQTLSVAKWESEHPYPINFSDSRSFNVAGAKFLRLVIKKYELEKKYDTLDINNGQNRSVQKVSGAGTDYETEYVIGDTMNVEFKSDRSVTKWGFVVESIQWQ